MTGSEGHVRQNQSYENMSHGHTSHESWPHVTRIMATCHTNHGHTSHESWPHITQIMATRHTNHGRLSHEPPQGRAGSESEWGGLP